ncbi:MAG: ATP phosphoribosyltransferase [Clostridiales bacterium]|nr:ATP phosphoribosyltransferase [Clostridiales bacterium]
MIRIAITKGRIEKDMCKLMRACGFDVEPIENKGRELLIKTKDDIEVIFAKANDVVTFIEHGIVDIGIVGKDTLEESDFTDYNELLDLNVGKCYFALAAYPEYKNKSFKSRKKIATKYPAVAKKYFSELQENVEIIKIEGSVELGPVIGLTDAIIDIVETGSTLKANGLEIIDKVSDISTRLIANKVSLKYKSEEIYNLVDKFYDKIKKNKGYCNDSNY